MPNYIQAACLDYGITGYRNCWRPQRFIRIPLSITNPRSEQQAQSKVHRHDSPPKIVPPAEHHTRPKLAGCLYRVTHHTCQNLPYPGFLFTRSLLVPQIMESRPLEIQSCKMKSTSIYTYLWFKIISTNILPLFLLKNPIFLSNKCSK